MIDIQGDDILSLIPQRPPMVVVDRLYGLNDIGCLGLHSCLTILPDNLFCESGVFVEAGIIEHMAQSAAARVGYRYMLENVAVPIGFIASVDKFKLYRLPHIGDILDTVINDIHSVDNIKLIEVITSINGELIAKCRMKIFMKTGT
ncbi:MAG: hydroxymyristoyl-ACP dehydratase [Prevotellaceae bacterium]|jgi:predicted hotdog family 3-hydroxylacyl-ACP dehydratase|nr:hydroxymyristoyl-ACP dehydratase [Prevotellaceae bacterium]